MVPKSKAELEALISDQVEESLQLEYKAAEALHHTAQMKKEIAKDVSAMANSAGGIIVYGMKEHDEPEKQHLPERITPIDRTQFSKESLEQTISSNISPKIEGLIIHPVPLDQSTMVAYVVEIPQSTTAHQNTVDGRYYKRFNFQSVWIMDYEIRDIMSRQKHPNIGLHLRIERDTYELRNPFPMPRIPISGNKEPEEEKTYRTDVVLKIFPVNDGSVLAQFVNYSVMLPRDIIDDEQTKHLRKFDEETLILSGENTYRDVVDAKGDALSGYSRVYGPSRYDPILPGMRGRSSSIRLAQDAKLDGRELYWKVHADNAPLRSGSVKINEIKIVEKKDSWC